MKADEPKKNYRPIRPRIITTNFIRHWFNLIDPLPSEAHMHMPWNTSPTCTCRSRKESLTPFSPGEEETFFSYWQDKKTGDPSTRMRAVLPLPRPILLFHGEKASDEGRFNALLIICKDVRLLPMYYRYIDGLKIRLCNAPRKSSLVKWWNLL